MSEETKRKLDEHVQNCLECSDEVKCVEYFKILLQQVAKEEFQ